ncbi:hypothetical protein D1007_01871 [Hordeum vulgare]|nr:hypothetical protein D1007_01871 [Hordeum vulgare]
MKMLSDPEIVKDVHLYVSKEKVGDDVAPPSKQFDIALSNHSNESVLLREGGVYAEGEGTWQLTMKRLQSHESEALDNEQGQDHNQVDKEVRKRKRTSLPIVWNMPKGQRIVVKCNENSQPIGDEGAILGKFLGTIARNGGFCPPNINDWCGVKKNSGEETILQCVQTNFVYPRSCEKWILKLIGRDWRKYKSSLKDAFFKPAIEKNPNIKRKAFYKLCPEDVNIDQWRGLVKFWKSKKGRALAEKNIISRSLVKNTHNAGTKSFACWSEDMRQVDPEKKRPHRSEVYLATHKKKDDANAENIDRNERLAGAKVVLKTSIYHSKRNVAYGTIRSTDQRTKVCGIELGAEFALVRIDQPLLDNEELVREVSDCKTIGEAFSSGYLIAWPSAFIREKDN